METSPILKLTMIKNIIFDFGGVLLDLRPDRCISEFKKIGIPEIENMLSLAHQQGVLDDMEQGKYTLEEFCNAMRSAHTGAFERTGRIRSLIPFMKDGNPIPAPTNRQIVNAFSSMADGIPAYRLDFVRQMKEEGYSVSALSNTNTVHWDYCLRYFIEAGYDPNELFDHLWLSCELHLVKPNPEIFKRVLEESGYKPEETLFVDDNKHNCEVAETFGIHTFCPQIRRDWTTLIRQYLH